MQDKRISDRIWITRYLMIIGIIVLHTPPYVPLAEVGGSLMDITKAFFAHGLFRSTVPVLTAISGYLMFSSSLYRDPRKLIRKKTESILVPFVLWNLPVAIAVYVVQRYGLVSHVFSTQLYPFEPVPWLNAVIGLFSAPVNYPLNFLRDLYVLCLLSPLIGWVLTRMPYLGVLLVAVIWYFNLDGDLILRNSMMVSFYTGALAAAKRWPLDALDRFAWPAVLAVIAMCLAIVFLQIENRTWFRLVSPFLIWPAMSLLVDSAAGRWLVRYSKYSFATFLAHGLILLILWMLYQRLLPAVPYVVFWFTAPIAVVGLCILMARTLKRFTPRLAQVLLGGR